MSTSVATASRVLTDVEIRYAQIEKEQLVFANVNSSHSISKVYIYGRSTISRVTKTTQVHISHIN